MVNFKPVVLGVKKSNCGLLFISHVLSSSTWSTLTVRVVIPHVFSSLQESNFVWLTQFKIQIRKNHQSYCWPRISRVQNSTCENRLMFEIRGLKHSHASLTRIFVEASKINCTSKVSRVIFANSVAFFENHQRSIFTWEAFQQEPNSAWPWPLEAKPVLDSLKNNRLTRNLSFGWSWLCLGGKGHSSNTNIYRHAIVIAKMRPLLVGFEVFVHPNRESS